MLKVENLVKKYGDKVAVNGLNFNVESGEIVGLLGLNGAGKSTTMNCITGYIAPTQGTITVDGHDILKEPRQAKSEIGYLPEVFSFYSDMKVFEYLDFICDLKGFDKNRKARREHIEEVCRKAGLEKLMGRMIRNLSKGYKQRAGFAQALIGNPKVLILDEPTVGLDPSQIIEIRQLIRDSGKSSTVIVSSHILSEIEAICSRIIVIHNGTIVADGPTSSLLTQGQGSSVTIRIRTVNQSILSNQGVQGTRGSEGTLDNQSILDNQGVQDNRESEGDLGNQSILSNQGIQGTRKSEGTLGDRGTKDNQGSQGAESPRRDEGNGIEKSRVEKVIGSITDVKSFQSLVQAEDGTMDYRITSGGKDIREDIFRAFSSAGITLLQLKSEENSLENTFLHLTGQDSPSTGTGRP